MRNLLILLFLFFSLASVAQEKIFLKAKSSNSAIVLRWAPDNLKLFRESIKFGFTLKRLEISALNLPTEMEWETGLVVKIIFPVAKEDTLWKIKANENQRINVLYGCLFPEKALSKEIENNLFGLSLISADMNQELAEMAGLYFKDSLIEVNKKYAYRIETNGAVKKSAVILIGPSEKNQIKEILDFNVAPRNNAMEINWRYKELMTDYSSFIIERSDDSVHFYNLIKENYVPMASQFEKNKAVTYYSDTNVVELKPYWYRICGIDFFGERGACSPVRNGMIHPLLKGEILIDTLYEKENNLAKISWHLSSEIDKAIIKEFSIQHCSKSNGKYLKLKQEGKSIEETELNLKDRSNYIKLSAISIYGDTISSWPELLLVPDRIPPLQPDSLTGFVDRAGKVTLNWKKNSDKDLMGYRVYRSNAIHEEFVEVVSKVVLINSFVDSVSTQTLTEEIYYRINAIDSNYNNSMHSIAVKLQKPDYIAPTVAPITRFSATSDGIYIKWNKSTSADIKRTELRKSADNKFYQKVFEVFAPDSTSHFLDTMANFGDGNYYRTIAIDDANNFTESESIYIIDQSIKKTKTDSVLVSVDRLKKEIQLQWKSPNEEVFSYTIYKSKKGEQLRSVKTVGKNELTLIDKELYISNNYIYAIKATLVSGREMMICDGVEVEF